MAVGRAGQQADSVQTNRRDCLLCTIRSSGTWCKSISGHRHDHLSGMRAAGWSIDDECAPMHRLVRDAPAAFWDLQDQGRHCRSAIEYPDFPIDRDHSVPFVDHLACRTAKGASVEPRSPSPTGDFDTLSGKRRSPGKRIKWNGGVGVQRDGDPPSRAVLSGKCPDARRYPRCDLEETCQRCDGVRNESLSGRSALRERRQRCSSTRSRAFTCGPWLPLKQLHECRSGSTTGVRNDPTL